jgi:Fe-S cluster assembly protein SufD
MITRLKTDAEKGFEALAVYNSVAFEEFKANGLPHRRVEEYKYTDLRALVKQAPSNNITHKFSNAKAFAGEIKGLGATDPLILMNYAFCETGYQLKITKDTELHINHSNESFSRLFIDIDAGVTLTLIEEEQEDAVQANRLLHITLGEGAKLDHYRLQKGLSAQSFNTFVAKAEGKAEIRSFSLNEGVSLSRNQYFITMKGDDGKLNLAGVAIQNGKFIADTTLQVRHEGLRGESREMFKYVLANGAKGVFQGKIIVDKEAQKTDGKMSSNCIMLDDSCEMMNKPELEIYADDVLCGHGATCGELDDDLMFYMLARGIDPVTAKNLLIQAFVGEAIELIENEAMKDIIASRIELALASSR